MSLLGLGSLMRPEYIQCRWQNLVNGVLMNDFDYTGRDFSFKTVFYISPYSYRLCPCSYEFEYLDYMTDSGEINENMFEKLLQSVMDKKCPHVDNTNEDYTADTKINGIHIAAAMETETVLERYQNDTDRTAPTGIFGITPCHVAVLKGKPKSLQATLDLYPYIREDWTFNYWYKVEADEDKIKFVESSFIEMCVRKDNPYLLNTFVTWAMREGFVNMDISSALRFVVTHRLSSCLDILMDSLKDLAHGPTYSNIIDCAIIVIILDEPKILLEILTVLSEVTPQYNYVLEIAEVCQRLPRSECLEVLKMFDIFTDESEPTEDRVRGLITMLQKHPDIEHDDVIGVLKSVSDVGTYINTLEFGETYLFDSLKYIVPVTVDGDPSPDPKLVKLLIDLGSNINMMSEKRGTPLKFLLNERVESDPLYYENLRRTVELLLNENPYFEVQALVDYDSDSALQDALKLDSKLISRSVLADHPSTMKLNNSLTTYSGHKEGFNYALNFLTPLLIECGYPVNRNILQEVDGKSLDPAEYVYIQHVLDAPRALNLLCRDVLRNHFQGRQIRYYVENVKMPKPVKDFLLLKRELLMINE